MANRTMNTDTVLPMKTAQKIRTDKIGFFDLARELRDNIYECALSNKDKAVVFYLRERLTQTVDPDYPQALETVFILGQNGSSLDPGIADEMHGDLSVNPRLLLTCHQILHEGAIVFCGNQLLFWIPRMILKRGSHQLAKKISKPIIPSTRHLVKSLTLGFSLVANFGVYIQPIWSHFQDTFPNLTKVTIYNNDDGLIEWDKLIVDKGCEHTRMVFASWIILKLSIGAGVVPHWASIVVYDKSRERDKIAEFNEQVVAPVWEEFQVNGTKSCDGSSGEDMSDEAGSEEAGSEGEGSEGEGSEGDRSIGEKSEDRASEDVEVEGQDSDEEMSDDEAAE